MTTTYSGGSLRLVIESLGPLLVNPGVLGRVKTVMQPLAIRFFAFSQVTFDGICLRGSFPLARTSLISSRNHVPLLSRSHGIDGRAVHVVVPRNGTDGESSRGNSRDVRGCGSFASAGRGGTLFEGNIMSASCSTFNCKAQECSASRWVAVGVGVDGIAWCPRQRWVSLAELQSLKGVPFGQRRYAAH